MLTFCIPPFPATKGFVPTTVLSLPVVPLAAPYPMIVLLSLDGPVPSPTRRLFWVLSKDNRFVDDIVPLESTSVSSVILPSLITVPLERIIPDAPITTRDCSS